MEAPRSIETLGLNPTERTVAHLLFFLGFLEPMQTLCTQGFGWVDQDGSVGVTTPYDWEDSGEGPKSEFVKVQLFVDETEQDLSFDEFRDYVTKLFIAFNEAYPQHKEESERLISQFLAWVQKLEHDLRLS